VLGQTAVAAAASTVPVHTGKTYRVELGLERAAGTSPSWLVTAVRTSYPGAEIAAVEHYNDQSATVLVSWKGPSSKMTVGDQVSPAIQGLQVPFDALPTGTVRSAQLVDMAPGSVQQAIDKTGGERAITLRLVLSGAILVTTWYLCSRILPKEHRR